MCIYSYIYSFWRKILKEYTCLPNIFFQNFPTKYICMFFSSPFVHIYMHTQTYLHTLFLGLLVFVVLKNSASLYK